MAAVGAVALLAGAGGIAWWASSGGGGAQTGNQQADSTDSSSDSGADSSSISGGPSSDHLTKTLIAGNDVAGYTQSQQKLDYSVGMYMYQTQGSCLPMDQLATRLDSDRDISTPRASARMAIAGQPENTSPNLLSESVEYDFDSPDQQGHNLTFVARVGGVLVTAAFWSETTPVQNIDRAFPTVAVKKAQAAGLPS
jgi:hypothetical protein